MSVTSLLFDLLNLIRRKSSAGLSESVSPHSVHCLPQPPVTNNLFQVVGPVAKRSV